jgi:hypothetical protein
MATLFCSNKLKTYIGFKENQIDKDSLSELNSWNGHLFTVNRKKCLFFMNHETYFSFIVYGIKKPDIKNLNELFITDFIKELNKLHLMTAAQQEALKNRFSKVFLHKSINNRKVIGTINNLIQIIEYYKGNYENFQNYLTQDTFLNTYLLKRDNHYFKAKDAVKDKINQFFNETING